MAMAVASFRSLKRTSFAKLLVSQTGNVQSHLFSLRREAHECSHNNDISEEDMKQVEEALNDKNVEVLDGNKETVATVLPDEVIEQTENFWVPDPETGVFVPAEETQKDLNTGPPAPPHSTGNGPSVLDQTVFVRDEADEKQV